MQILGIKKEKKGRLLIETDEIGVFPLYEKEAVRFGLKEGGILSEKQWDELCREVLKKRVIRRTLYLLQRQDRTEEQLRRKLKENKYPDFLIEDALDYVRSYHYTDDLRYAQNYIHYHQEEKSRQQLIAALRSRGVPPEILEQALETSYTSEEAQIIGRLLEKKGYEPAAAGLKERQKMYQYLLRRGFSNSEIRRQMHLT